MKLVIAGGKLTSEFVKKMSLVLTFPIIVEDKTRGVINPQHDYHAPLIMEYLETHGYEEATIQEIQE